MNGPIFNLEVVIELYLTIEDTLLKILTKDTREIFFFGIDTSEFVEEDTVRHRVEECDTSISTDYEDRKLQ